MRSRRPYVWSTAVEPTVYFYRSRLATVRSRTGSRDRHEHLSEEAPESAAPAGVRIGRTRLPSPQLAFPWTCRLANQDTWQTDATPSASLSGPRPSDRRIDEVAEKLHAR